MDRIVTSLPRLLLLVLVTVAVPVALHAQDTLRTYDVQSRLVSYRNPSIVMHAARFDVSSSYEITSVTVTLGGSSNDGSVRMHVYGQEGGLPAPILQNDLIEPITINKTRSGVQRLVVSLPEVIISGSQFFVAFDALSPGVIVMSDSRKRLPQCKSRFDDYYSQYMKTSAGDWVASIYTYAVDVVVEAVKQTVPVNFVDVTKQSGILDSLAINESMAWYDINDDNLIDVLVSGKLYTSHGDGSFTDVTTSAGIEGQPRLNCFLDINNDAQIDILFLGSTDTATPGSYVFLNTGNGSFRRESLNIPELISPTTFSIADANQDGYLDIFVGQWSADQKKTVHNYLFLNNRHNGFDDHSDLLGTDGSTTNASTGSQWVDVDNNGQLELFVANDNGVSRLLSKEREGHYVPHELWSEWTDGQSSGWNTIGGHWADYDGNGYADVLLPSAVRPEHAGTKKSIILTNDGTNGGTLSDVGSRTSMEYNDKHAGGSWGDVNNDGLLDAFVTTACDCHYVSLYLQQPGNTFVDYTALSGLGRISAGKDAIWVDFNNDGNIDLATISKGHLLLLQNISKGNNAYLEVALNPADGNQVAIGSRVAVYAGGVIYNRTVTSGRGYAMQDPLKLHFGLGDSRTIDSVVVWWAGNPDRAETFTGLNPNATYHLKPGSGMAIGSTQQIKLSAAPNPFTTELTIEYELPTRMQVKLAIYNLEGQLVGTLIDQPQDAGLHTAHWIARDDQGKSLPQGMYLYRLTSPGIDVIGRVQLIR